MRQTPMLIYQDTEDLATNIENTDASYSIFKDDIYGEENKDMYVYTK